MSATTAIHKVADPAIAMTRNTPLTAKENAMFARMFHVVAVTQTDLLVITQGGLLVRLRRDPSFAVEMLHRLSGRVRSLNRQVEESDPT